MTNPNFARARFPRVRAPLLALVLAVALPMAPAAAQTSPALIDALEGADASSREIRAFYRARAFEPLWIRDDMVGPEAATLLTLIETAELDGLDPDTYRPRTIAKSLDRAMDGSPRDLAKAEMLLSRAFVALARDMLRPRDIGMLYNDAELAPRRVEADALLAQAATAPSLRQHLESIGWMNPVYARLRNAAAAEYNGDSPEADLRLVRLNLDRARALPANLGKRYVLVDAAAARLWMYEDGRVAGTMKVVVGRPDQQTPMMAALIRYASVNPYWNVPPDLVAERIAPNVLQEGVPYLKAKGYQVLSDWSDYAKVVPADQVDWNAAASNVVQLRVRQLPGPANAMGRVKFMFPNKLGIYLHDTPQKTLLKEEARMFSAGCVRLEDAPRLARWLFGKPVPMGTGKPERRVDLSDPVPVYITYLTTGVEGGRLVLRDDVYNRDEVQLASR
ncbi:L,D-transpeptidase family protein [Sphingomonas xinjiangensis]|uniref:Murein L,D-transpeptidase YcbB/YkuD n=1 Tax=Sphingomonas xinjiangensis TaxID=643568 RepID=A0A840YQM5_9SPHN|nr:L,D-transpeptidase family protein [Sphingomonas xinjiangensis]MBB5711351.1 murein L,D-transpeptidase YcbB/YkuD [Sphingomonas xinjiangensis]